MDKITLIYIIIGFIGLLLILHRLFNAFEGIQGYPRYIRNVWYNFYVYSREDFPIVFDKEGKYIPCQEGNKVIGFKTKEGKNVYYTITNIEYKSASDYLYDSDGYHCDLKFSHVEKLING